MFLLFSSSFRYRKNYLLNIFAQQNILDHVENNNIRRSPVHARRHLHRQAFQISVATKVILLVQRKSGGKQLYSSLWYIEYMLLS